MATALTQTLQLVQIDDFVAKGEDKAACELVATSLRECGAVLIRDSRVNAQHADKFLDMMERYFAQPRSVKMRDTRPEYSYQVCLSQCRSAYSFGRGESKRAKSNIF